MGRNLNRSKASYKKRCFWYKSKENFGKIVIDDKLMGVFYAKLLSINKNSYVDGPVRRTLKNIMIETPDSVGLNVDDFVKLDDVMYRVISIDDIPLAYGRFNHTITLQGGGS